MVTLKIVSGNKCSMDPRSVEVNFSFSVRSTHLFVYDIPEELHGIGRENALCRIDGNTIFLISIEYHENVLFVSALVAISFKTS
ncbi:unnamed protein product [Macrosiphum euphorbiae]|uniref:Uncharacterized protein n=1 Tax=Macrosiphum euphorbiae TaxID=13131 RepID=A0AAV0WWV4_9HEMI|nr:unnamed protein product [Macrosiphum euphorbiae]